MKIKEMVLDAMNRFSNGEICTFRAFPGFAVMCLMKDQGLIHLPVHLGRRKTPTFLQSIKVWSQSE